MKKLFMSLLVSFLLFVGASTASACWNVIDVKVVDRGVEHHFVDRDCDGTIDIVQEYVWNGHTWLATRWWTY